MKDACMAVEKYPSLAQVCMWRLQVGKFGGMFRECAQSLSFVSQTSLACHLLRQAGVSCHLPHSRSTCTRCACNTGMFGASNEYMFVHRFIYSSSQATKFFRCLQVQVVTLD